MAMPFPGSTFKVTAEEASLGPGTITVLEGSLLFEAGNRKHLGFDFNNARLVSVRDNNGFDVAFSFQGSIQKASFVTTPRYLRKNEGIEKDVATNAFECPMVFWKLHTITGAVVARTLVDRSGAQCEGFSEISEDEFQSQIRQARDIIDRLPAQLEIETRKATSQHLNGLERELTDILLRLTNAWLTGNLSQPQRENLAALNYRDQLKRYELGWYHTVATEFYTEMTNQDYKENADDWLAEEMKWGSNLQGTAGVRDLR
jgi:hypothetical protein